MFFQLRIQGISVGIMGCAGSYGDGFPDLEDGTAPQSARERASPALFVGVARLVAKPGGPAEEEEAPALAWQLGAFQFFDDVVCGSQERIPST